ncbi:MAG: YceI family protein [Flavobacteriia bacterium]|nr:YceI family protein [Flavobacteriia bacterium]
MKKVSIFAIAAFALFSFVKLESMIWTVDAVHSNFQFSINHLGINDFKGSFGNYTSTISSTKEDFSDAKIELNAEVSSINTGNTMRDEHLKGAEYFDIATYPTFNFKSTSFTKLKGNTYKVVGDLTFHGVTKSVTLEAIHNGSTVHPMNKKTVSGFKITGAIKRSDFNFAKEMPSAMLSDEVKISADLEYAKN